MLGGGVAPPVATPLFLKSYMSQLRERITLLVTSGRQHNERRDRDAAELRALRRRCPLLNKVAGETGVPPADRQPPR